MNNLSLSLVLSLKCFCNGGCELCNLQYKMSCRFLFERHKAASADLHFTYSAEAEAADPVQSFHSTHQLKSFLSPLFSPVKSAL